MTKIKVSFGLISLFHVILSKIHPERFTGKLLNTTEPWDLKISQGNKIRRKGSPLSSIVSPQNEEGSGLPRNFPCKLRPEEPPILSYLLLEVVVERDESVENYKGALVLEKFEEYTGRVAFFQPLR